MGRVNKLRIPPVQKSHALWLGSYQGTQRRFVLTESDGDGDIHLQVGPEDATDSVSLFLTPAQARKLGMVLLEVSDE